MTILVIIFDVDSMLLDSKLSTDLPLNPPIEMLFLQTLRTHLKSIFAIRRVHLTPA